MRTIKIVDRHGSAKDIIFVPLSEPYSPQEVAKICGAASGDNGTNGASGRHVLGDNSVYETLKHISARGQVDKGAIVATLREAPYNQYLKNAAHYAECMPKDFYIAHDEYLHK